MINLANSCNLPYDSGGTWGNPAPGVKCFLSPTQNQWANVTFEFKKQKEEEASYAGVCFLE